MSKIASARPYSIPSSLPNYMFQVQDTVYKFYKERNECTMFQERDGHVQRLRLVESDWHHMIETVRNLVEADKQSESFLKTEFYE